MTDAGTAKITSGILCAECACILPAHSAYCTRGSIRTAPRLVHLEVNCSGAWKRVMTFDVQDEGEVLHEAAALLRWASHKITARVIMPGETAPLMNWSAADGWREFGAAK